MGLWGTRQPVSQPGGDSAPQHQNGCHQARRGPGTRMRSVAEGILPTFRPLGRGEGRESREGNTVQRLESSRPGPRRGVAVPRARREGGNLHKMAEQHAWTGGSAIAGGLPPDPQSQFPDLRNRKRVPGARPGESGRGRSPGSASGLGRAHGPAASAVWQRCEVEEQNPEVGRAVGFQCGSGRAGPCEGSDPTVGREGALQRDPRPCPAPRGKRVWPARG